MSVSLGTSWKNDFENAISGNSVGLMFFDENYRLRRLTDIVIKAGFIDESALGLLVDEIKFPLSYPSIAIDIHKAGSKMADTSRLDSGRIGFHPHLCSCWPASEEL